MIWRVVFTEKTFKHGKKFWRKRNAMDFAMENHWLGDTIYLENLITRKWVFIRMPDLNKMWAEALTKNRSKIKDSLFKPSKLFAQINNKGGLNHALQQRKKEEG